jgi:23S rRNA (guanosine2251-2'-O)-methyltransferase
MRDSLIVYGKQVINTLLECDSERVSRLVVADNKVGKSFAQLARSYRVPVDKVPAKKLDEMCDNELHQGAIALLKGWPYQDEKDLYTLVENNQGKNTILVLDNVQDPHNLGACIRTADASGVTAVVIPKDNSSKLTSVVAKVSCGGLFTVPICRVTNLSRVMAKLQDLGVWFIGTDLSAEGSIDKIDLTGNVGIVMGAEGEGLRELTKKHCDFFCKLPMLGAVESLNVSVSTGICLYEVLRQRA